MSTTIPKLSTIAATFVVTVLLVASFLGYFRLFDISAASTGNLNVSSETESGAELTGYWVIVTTTSGATVATGFSPFGADLSPGNYLVGVGDYGGYVFSSWSDGTTSRFHPVTIGSSGAVYLTAIYSSSSSSGGSIEVTSDYSDGSGLYGMYAFVQLNGVTVGSGFTPVTFSASAPGSYTVTVDDYTNAYFYQWSDGTCSNSETVTVSGGEVSLNAEYTTNQQTPSTCAPSSSGGAVSGSPDGITVTANRIPASYWAPCFATVCSAGTGPGATMFFTLYDSSGGVVATAFANENGYTFTGLTPGATYYVYPADCDNCHGSDHDVIFEYWGDGLGSTRPLAVTVGESVAAWYSCTNGCGGG